MSRSLSVFLLVYFGLFPSLAPAGAHAQEGKDSTGPFFKKSEIDFWGTAAKTVSPLDRKGTSSGRDFTETLFAEPVRMSDGRTTIYVPPREVLAFLEDPTRENARSYLQWQNARAEKISAAMEALESVKREESPALDLPKRDAPRRDDAKTSADKKPSGSAIRLTYFRQSG